MTDTGDAQDLAEALDADKLPGDSSSPDSDGPALEPDYPLDAPLGVEDDTVTQRMEQVGESLADRVGREVPDPLAVELDRAADAATSAATPLGPLEDAVGTGVVAGDAPLDDRGEPVGRLAAPGSDDVLDAAVDLEGTAVAAEVEDPTDSADLSPEEAAVHVTAEPALGHGDGGYLQDR